MDTSNTSKPKKSILKPPSNFEESHTDGNNGPKMTWDEENIIETFHPENKTYGHRKIDEPKTPYNYMSEGEDVPNSYDDSHIKIDPEELAKKLQEQNQLGEDETDLTAKESVERRRSFEQQRKLHYNEFLAAKMAAVEDDDEEEDGEEEDITTGRAGASRADPAPPAAAQVTGTTAHQKDIDMA